MKLAWIVYGSLEQRTGGTIYDAQIVSGLQRRGDRIEVMSISRGADPSALVRRLACSRPDVVVGDELCFSELAFVFSRTSFTRRVLLVHHLTCWEEELPLAVRQRARRWEAVVLRSSDRLVATSHATRARLVTEGHRGRIDVVLPGADRLELLPRAVDDGPTCLPRFLFIGAVIPRKRALELVRAFASVEPPAVLRLVGSRDRDPRHVREIERTIAELGLGDRVTLLGEVDDGAIARELALAHALVMPSSLEGYGIAATEAARAGTPVLAARTAGLEEALAPCVGATIFVNDTPALAKAMNDVAMDAHLRASMHEACSRSRMPTWDEAVTAFRTALM